MISIDLKGASDALETLAGIVIPWRKENAARKAKLELAQKQAEIQRFNSETLITQAKAERERVAVELDKTQADLILSQAKKTEAEASLLLAQAQKAMVDAEKERSVMRQAQIELAMKIVEKYAPNLNELEKMDFMVNKLLPVLNQLITSEIEPQILP